MTPALSEPVRIGQIWLDNDPRKQARRLVRVHAIGGAYAIVENCNPDYGGLGKRTRVRLDRFNPNRQTGYTLVTGATT